MRTDTTRIDTTRTGTAITRRGSTGTTRGTSITKITTDTRGRDTTSHDPMTSMLNHLVTTAIAPEGAPVPGRAHLPGGTTEEPSVFAWDATIIRVTARQVECRVNV